MEKSSEELIRLKRWFHLNVHCLEINYESYYGWCHHKTQIFKSIIWSSTLVKEIEVLLS